MTQRLLGIGFVICHWKHALDKRPKRLRFIHTVLEILTLAASSKLDKLGLQVMNAARFQGRRHPVFLPEAKIALASMA